MLRPRRSGAVGSRDALKLTHCHGYHPCRWAEILSPGLSVGPLCPLAQSRRYALTELLAGRLTTSEAPLTLDFSIRHLKVR